jgi:hypothetical protein
MVCTVVAYNYTTKIQQGLYMYRQTDRSTDGGLVGGLGAFQSSGNENCSKQSIKRLDTYIHTCW